MAEVIPTPGPTSPPPGPTSSETPTTPPPPSSDVTPTQSPTSEPPTSAPPPESSTGQPPTSDPQPTSSGTPTTPPPSDGVSSTPPPSGSGSATPGPGSESVSPTGGVSSLPSGVTPGSSADPNNVVTITTVVTRSDGSLVTDVITSQRPTDNKSSNTGAIAGGVVGGVVGLAIIAGLIFWLVKRRRRNRLNHFDDMMFDPARPQNQANIDLADNGPTLEPYSYTPVHGVAATSTGAHGSQEMSQAYPYSASQATTSDYGVSRNPSSATSNMAGLGAGAAGVGAGAGAYAAGHSFPQPQPYPSGSAHPDPQEGMSSKQREAYQESQRFHIQNQTPYPGGSGSQPVVHTDGGAYTETGAETDAPEIPPTYDSIRR